ncbi:MAG: ribbon-helix-helix protein, CopG family [Gammaproteobacteria bacterium]
MPTSVRLDVDTEALLARLARTSGRTKSDVLREALVRMAAAEQIGEVADGPYSLIEDLVGIAHGGPSDLARNHKRAFREALTKTKRR